MLFERGFNKKPVAYELQKMYSPYSFLATGGALNEKTTYQDDLKLMSTFYKKYPEVKYFPHGSSVESK